MSSDFIYTNIADRSRFERIEIVETQGALCDYFVVTSEGKSFFMKRLKDEHSADKVSRSILAKEHEIGCTIDHPNIVKHVSINDDENGYYLLMENVIGMTLNRFISTYPDYFHRRANLDKFFNQLLSALKCLHAHHIVYSDLKPENIMLTQVGNDVKLIDLGFCMTNAYTMTAGTTEGYSAPEQISKGTLNIATDIYGIGKIIEYIGQNIPDSLPNIYARIMVKCTKERQKDRFQDTDEIVHLINRRRHVIRKSTIWAVCCVVMFLAIRTIAYTEVFNSWWDSFEIITPSVEHDTQDTSTLYRILSEKDRTCEVVGHTTNPNAYINPTTVIDGKTYRVVQIADEAFANKSYLRSVYICEGVEAIGVRAFRHCSNLVSVTIPSSVKVIKNGAFFECRNLTSIKLPTTMTCIERGAFAGTGISNITIPEGITRLELDLLGNCEFLESVDLPKSLTLIDRGVFFNCPALTQITIPENVESLGELLFWDSDNLRHIYNHAVTPQQITPFHRNVAQLTVHVPAESVEAYKAAPIWRDMTIVPLNDSK